MVVNTLVAVLQGLFLFDNFDLSFWTFALKLGWTILSLIGRIGLSEFFLMKLINCLFAREFVLIRKETLVTVEQSSARLDHIVVESELLAIEHKGFFGLV